MRPELFSDRGCRRLVQGRGTADQRAGRPWCRVLASGLRADGDEESFAFAEWPLQDVAPSLMLGDAVGAPAAEVVFDHKWADGEGGRRCGRVAQCVFEGEMRRGGADGEDVVFDAGGEELFDGTLTYGEAIGLHQVAGVGGDLVELVLSG